MKIESQEISSPLLEDKKIRLFIKRLDIIDAIISGNKWFKLKYNLIEAKRQGHDTLLTFGGAYSNHIAAVATLANLYGFKSIGIIRGERHDFLNSTLSHAEKMNMHLHYISRSKYCLKDNKDFLDKIKLEFGEFYLLPEGGTNNLAVKGTSEILDPLDVQDYICCPVGSGGTISGIVNSSSSSQNVIGFPAIRDYSKLEIDIKKWVLTDNWTFIDDYSFGGYARFSDELVDFINNFYVNHKIPLDIIYTGKMMFGVVDLIKKDYFASNSSILAIHTGGLQGNIGMRERLGVNLSF